jgi:amino acid transporter
MVGHAGGMILATPRMLFAFARDGFLPAALVHLHPQHRSPVAAILLQCAVVLVLAIGLAVAAAIFAFSRLTGLRHVRTSTRRTAGT